MSLSLDVSPSPRSAASSMKQHLKPGGGLEARKRESSPGGPWSLLLQHFLHKCQAPPIACASRALKAEEEGVICNILPHLLPFACCCQGPLRPMQLCKRPDDAVNMFDEMDRKNICMDINFKLEGNYGLPRPSYLGTPQV